MCCILPTVADGNGKSDLDVSDNDERPKVTMGKRRGPIPEIEDHLTCHPKAFLLISMSLCTAVQDGGQCPVS